MRGAKMPSIELKPCPFCGYGKIHLRRKSETRESVTGAKALITQAWGPDYEVPVADWRFGVKYYCGKCYASTGYQWGGWHVPTEGEIETYEDYLYNIPYQFDHYESRDEVIREAAEAWNTRAYPPAGVSAATWRELERLKERKE